MHIRGADVLCPNLGARRVWAVSTTTRPLYPFYRRLGRSWCVLAKRKSLPPTGDRAADRTTRSELLYRLRCPGHHMVWTPRVNTTNNRRTRTVKRTLTLINSCYREWSRSYQGVSSSILLKFRYNRWPTYMWFKKKNRIHWCFRQWKKPELTARTRKRTMLNGTSTTNNKSALYFVSD
jgi:hypothetical protein